MFGQRLTRASLNCPAKLTKNLQNLTCYLLPSRGMSSIEFFVNRHIKCLWATVRATRPFMLRKNYSYGTYHVLRGVKFCFFASIHISSIIINFSFNSSILKPSTLIELISAFKKQEEQILIEEKQLSRSRVDVSSTDDIHKLKGTYYPDRLPSDVILVFTC